MTRSPMDDAAYFSERQGCHSLALQRDDLKALVREMRRVLLSSSPLVSGIPSDEATKCFREILDMLDKSSKPGENK